MKCNKFIHYFNFDSAPWLH